MHPDDKEPRGHKTSKRGSRSARSDSNGRPVEHPDEAAKHSAPVKTQPGPGAPHDFVAPAQREPTERLPQPNGLARQPTPDMLQAALAAEPDLEIVPETNRKPELAVQEVVAKEPAAQVTAAGDPKPDLHDAAAIQDWLEDAKRRLAAACPEMVDPNAPAASAPVATSGSAAGEPLHATGAAADHSKQAGHIAAVSGSASIPDETIVSTTSSRAPSKSVGAPSIAEESMQPQSQSVAEPEESMRPLSHSAAASAPEQIPSDMQSAEFGARSVATGHGSTCSERDEAQSRESKRTDVQSVADGEHDASLHDSSKVAGLGQTGQSTAGAADQGESFSVARSEDAAYDCSRRSGRASLSETGNSDARNPHDALGSSLQSSQANLNATGRSEAALGSTRQSSRKDLGATGASYADDFEEYDEDFDDEEEESGG